MSLLHQRQGRIAVFTLLYLSEGAPIGFIWWALPTMLRTAGVAVPKITALTAMLVLPWVFKFLWAPLVDAMRTPRWGFRAWIISAQLAMGATLLPLIWLDPTGHFQLWGVLLLLHAFSAATQDVAIDAMAINLVPEHQRGTLNGCMQAGMLVGRSLFGGGALLVAAAGGIAWVIVALGRVHLDDACSCDFRPGTARDGRHQASLRRLSTTPASRAAPADDLAGARVCARGRRRFRGHGPARGTLPGGPRCVGKDDRRVFWPGSGRGHPCRRFDWREAVGPLGTHPLRSRFFSSASSR